MRKIPGVSLPRRSCRIQVIVFLVLCNIYSVSTRADGPSGSSPRSEHRSDLRETRNSACSTLYLGIVGGLETPGNHRSGVVQIRDALRNSDYSDVCAKSVSAYLWRSGLVWLLQYFPSAPRQLSEQELAGAPKIILVGHSLGGWAVLSIARNLNRRNIPVELCVQIDSVGITDHTVPRNVRSAAIFHARDILWPLVTTKIKLQDPDATTLVDNVLVRGAGHESVTRDSRIRDLVFRTVDSLRASSCGPRIAKAGCTGTE